MSTNNFQDQLLKGFWHDLKDHLERGAIIVVDANLDLNDVAKAVALDQAKTVQSWIEKKLLVKPTLDQIHSWNSNPTKEFQFAIAQPYVLIQELGH